MATSPRMKTPFHTLAYVARWGKRRQLPPLGLAHVTTSRRIFAFRQLLWLLDSVNACNSDLYPNIHALLQLLLCLPVGSCCCERSFSAPRRLKTYLRTTTSETRLNGLADIHKDIHVNLDRVLQRWDGLGHRRIHMAFKTPECHGRCFEWL